MTSKHLNWAAKHPGKNPYHSSQTVGYNLPIHNPRRKLGNPTAQETCEFCHTLFRDNKCTTDKKSTLDPTTCVCSECAVKVEQLHLQVQGMNIKLPGPTFPAGFEPDYINLVRDLFEKHDPDRMPYAADFVLAARPMSRLLYHRLCNLYQVPPQEEKYKGIPTQGFCMECEIQYPYWQRQCTECDKRLCFTDPPPDIADLLPPAEQPSASSSDTKRKPEDEDSAREPKKRPRRCWKKGSRKTRKDTEKSNSKS